MKHTQPIPTEASRDRVRPEKCLECEQPMNRWSAYTFFCSQACAANWGDDEALMQALEATGADKTEGEGTSDRTADAIRRLERGIAEIREAQMPQAEADAQIAELQRIIGNIRKYSTAPKAPTRMLTMRKPDRG